MRMVTIASIAMMEMTDIWGLLGNLDRDKQPHTYLSFPRSYGITRVLFGISSKIYK
jgi:hypothetical protein